MAHVIHQNFQMARFCHKKTPKKVAIFDINHQTNPTDLTPIKKKVATCWLLHFLAFYGSSNVIYHPVAQTGKILLRRSLFGTPKRISQPIKNPKNGVYQKILLRR